MPRKKTNATPASANDHSGEPPSITGAVINATMSMPRNRLRIKVGGTAPDSVATIGLLKSTFFAVTQRTAPSQPAMPVMSAIATPSSTLRSAPPEVMPTKAGTVATCQARASSSGTTIATVRTCEVRNGNMRARPPVRDSTRSIDMNGTSTTTRIRPEMNGLSVVMPRASKA